MEVRFPAGLDIFLFAAASAPTLGPTQPMVTRTFPQVTIQPERKAEHLLPSSARFTILLGVVFKPNKAPELSMALE
jgi:hypothetical protein